MPFDFPQNPTINQEIEHAGKRWRFDGIGWKALLPNTLKGFTGEEGRRVQLQKSATHIQWRYAGDFSWNDLVPLSAIKGDKGDDGDKGNDGGPGPRGPDGREVQFQKSATHLQWRYEGEAGWTNLVALSDITGPKGDNGEPGKKGEKGDPGTITAVTTADKGVTAVAMVTTGLSFNVVTDGIYAFKFVLTVQSGAAAVGMKVGLGGTATIGPVSALVRTITGADGVGTEFVGSLSAGNDVVTIPELAALETPQCVIVEGTVKIDWGGTFFLSFGSTAAGVYLQLKQGSVATLQPAYVPAAA